MGKYSFKKTITWIILNTLILILFYYALIMNNNNALNVLKFFLWVNLIQVFLTLMAVYKNDNKTKFRDKVKTRSVPDFINVAFGIITAFALAYYGHFFYASIDMFTTFMQVAFYQTIFDDEQKNDK